MGSGAAHGSNGAPADVDIFMNMPAPHLVRDERPHPFCSSSRRLRRRGPRSALALCRRAQAREQKGSPPGGASGEAEVLPPANDLSKAALGFSTLHFNIRSINNSEHQAELFAHLEVHRPDLLALSETWLDASTKHLSIPGYEEVSRRDRPGHPGHGLNHGGIALYCRTCSGLAVAHVGDSEVAERSWHILHAHDGPFLIGLWYRPPRSELDHITTLAAEMNKFLPMCVGCILIGDMNVWHKRWLRHSPSTSPEGRCLHDICADFGLQQVVRQPTRGENLLDLVLTSCPQDVKVKILPQIADHAGVLAQVRRQPVINNIVIRQVWDFSKADWVKLNKLFADTDWRDLLGHNANEAAEHFAGYVLSCAKECIPSRTIGHQKSSHPWLNERCRAAIAKKHSREGCADYAEAAQQCSTIIGSEYQDYVQRLRSKLLSLPRSSKQWWKINRQLLHNIAKPTSTPPLQHAAGTWATHPKDKASLLMESFRSKFVLAPCAVGEQDLDLRFLTYEAENRPDITMAGFAPIRHRWAKHELRKLDADTATGPDLIPARVLKMCASTLSIPIVLLVRLMLATGVWPQCWKLHWLFPIYKKGPQANPGNYRGIHLTSNVSKLCERMLNRLLQPFFSCQGSFGLLQHAFQKGRSCPDLIVILVCSWLLAFQKGQKVGLYLSDIAGAFDRVHVPRLMAKLQSTGISQQFMKFFADYLSPRRAQVIVSGSKSDLFEISNMVYQGSVLGPSLWNIFFQDVHEVAEECGASDAKFADDLTIFKLFDTACSNEDVQAAMAQCQTSAHHWGARNKVCFEASKEHFAVLHHVYGEGDSFRLLGPMFDAKLLMHDAVDRIIAKTRPKLTALLKSRRYFTTHEMVRQFKTHILPMLESNTGAIYHAADSVLSPIDQLLDHFLRALGLSSDTAFLQHNMAPLSLRRDIAMLGVLHKCAHGRAHPDLLKLFPLAPPTQNSSRHNTRLSSRRHGKQLLEMYRGSELVVFRRSVFGLTRVFNVLPEDIVESISVSSFQGQLTRMAKEACQNGRAQWHASFSPRL